MHDLVFRNVIKDLKEEIKSVGSVPVMVLNKSNNYGTKIFQIMRCHNQLHTIAGLYTFNL